MTDATDALARALNANDTEIGKNRVANFIGHLAALGYEVRPMTQAAEAADREAAGPGNEDAGGARPTSAAADPLDVEALAACPSLMAILNRLGSFNGAWWDRLAAEYAAAKGGE